MSEELIDKVKQRLEQVFLNNSNCWEEAEDGEVTPTMDKDTFVEVVTKLMENKKDEN